MLLGLELRHATTQSPQAAGVNGCPSVVGITCSRTVTFDQQGVATRTAKRMNNPLRRADILIPPIVFAGIHPIITQNQGLPARYSYIAGPIDPSGQGDMIRRSSCLT